LPVRFEVPKTGRTQLNGLFAVLDDETGNAIRVERVAINADRTFKG
jgi:calcineurin-like phosphoesterase